MGASNLGGSLFMKHGWTFKKNLNPLLFKVLHMVDVFVY